MAVFLALSIVSGIAALSALRQLSQGNYDSSGIAAVQLRLHFDLLLSELKVLEMSDADAATDAAVLQYDIVYQRLHSLPNRPPYTTILTDRDRLQLRRITEEIEAVAPTFDASKTGGAKELKNMRARLNDIRFDIDLLNGRILELMRVYRETRRANIVYSTRFLIISMLGLVLTGGVFAVLLWRSLVQSQRQNAELESLTKKLIKANQAKSEFLASISHELRTPLNAIIGFSELIKNEVFGKITERKYTEYAGDINLSGTHLLQLINDILDLSKIEAGEFRVAPVYINLRQAVTETARIVDQTSERGSSRVLMNIADGLDELYVDPRSFRQIMINLLSNAHKYAPDDSPIVIAASPGDEGGVNIRIIDKGIGIPEQDQQLVLEPFGQSRRNSSETHEGTGLGLSLCKQLMELNGGTLRLESVVDAGTTVHLWFPDAPASHEPD